MMIFLAGLQFQSLMILLRNEERVYIKDIKDFTVMNCFKGDLIWFGLIKRLILKKLHQMIVVGGEKQTGEGWSWNEL